MTRRLVVNADDFGFTRGVNEGILACHREGIVTAATLMATGRAFRHAVDLAHSTPTLSVGCHLVLVQGPDLPPTIPALLNALAWRTIDPHAVFSRQVNMIMKAGVRPTHLDTHKHTHVLPRVLDAVLRISGEFGIPWVRRPVDFAVDALAPRMQQRSVAAMRWLLRSFPAKLENAHARATGHFAGFQLTGRMTEQNLARVLRTLPEGTSELMCHPGYLTDELRQATTRLRESREEEIRALCSPLARQAIAETNIHLVSYREL